LGNTKHIADLAGRRELAASLCILTACPALLLGCMGSDGSLDSSGSGLSAGLDLGSDWDPCSTVPDEDWHMVSLEEHPSLLEPGGSALLSLDGVAVLAVHLSEGCFAAVSATCTHEGETLQYQELGNRFTCPMHGATFGIQGDVLAGPTSIPLSSYPVGESAGSIWIRLS
jgi:nitrite reductase/ring-hydroxylating ferredoxin subunit